MSGKQNSKLLYRLPPQGKRRESINVYISFVPVTKEKEQEIDRLILKSIMKN